MSIVGSGGGEGEIGRDKFNSIRLYVRLHCLSYDHHDIIKLATYGVGPDALKCNILLVSTQIVC